MDNSITNSCLRAMPGLLLACLITLFAVHAGAATQGSVSTLYVTFITGLNTGGTNVYEIDSGKATLKNTLSHGGGGPVAVDAQQNAYVIQANFDDSFYQSDAAVFMYAPGSTTGDQIFDIPQFGAAAMTVSGDGTVYVAGQVPESDTFKVLKLAPPNYSPQLLWKSDEKRFPTGISVSSNGDVYVGWAIDVKNYPFNQCAFGCITELPAGQT